jgi:ubiquitin C-terminal hydrolase
MIKKNKKYNNTKKLSYKKNKKNTQKIIIRNNKKYKTLKKRKHIGGGVGNSICEMLNKVLNIKHNEITFSSDEKLEYKGITNFGNSCYMNATIQMLWSIPEFRIFFNAISLEDINTINFKERKTNKHPIKKIEESYQIKNIDKNALISLFHIFKYFSNKTNKKPYIMIEDIYQGLRKINTNEQIVENKNKNKNNKYLRQIKMFGNKSQEDSFEFLSHIFDSLKDNIINNTSITNLIDSFKFQETSVFTCSETNTIVESDTKYNGFYLTLEIKHNSVKQNLQEYLKVEDLSTDISNKLNACNTSHNLLLNKKLKFIFDKKIKNLIIIIKRFSHEGNGGNGNKTRSIVTPETILNFNTIDTINPHNIVFKLQGCIIHLGPTPRSGHYIYLVFDKDGNPDKIINDSINNQAPDNSYLTDGYIYYYRRFTPLKI